VASHRIKHTKLWLSVLFNVESYSKIHCDRRCEIWGSDSDVTEDSGVLGCYGVLHFLNCLVQEMTLRSFETPLTIYQSIRH